MKKILFIAFLSFIAFCACEETWPPQVKPTIPADHTEEEGGVYHKPGLDFPYGYNEATNDKNCAGATCHHSDLRGGLAKKSVRGKVEAVSPSCYQCHGKVWEDISSAGGD